MPPEETPITPHPLEQTLIDSLLMSKRIGEETNQLLETMIKQNIDRGEGALLQDALVLQAKILAQLKEANTLNEQIIEEQKKPLTVKLILD